MTDQPKQLAVTNYDKIKALANNETTIQRFAAMLGSKPYAMSYISSAMLAVANSPDLMECTPSSVFNSVMRAAALRLSCDPATKQAHIIPFNNNKTGKKEAQFIPGYVGINQMAHRTGKYRVLNTSVLYDGQVLEINQLTGAPRLTGSKKSSKVVGYFHYFQLHDGFEHILYMTVSEMEEHCAKYAKNNPTWRKEFDKMARKTVTRLHLLRDGILDPFDKAMIEQADESRADGEMIENNDQVDAQFTQADDDTAAAEAAARKIEEANRPRRTEAEIKRDLGIEMDEEPPAPAPEIPAENIEDSPKEAAEYTIAQRWPADAKVSLDLARTVKSSDGVPYLDLEPEKLLWHVNGNQTKLKANNLTPEARSELQLKIDTARIVLKIHASNNQQ